MKILIKGKVDMVSIYRAKPAHFGCAPDQSNDVERKTVKKTTNSQTAGNIRGTRKEQKGSSSKITPKPVRQGFESHKCAKRQFSTRTTGSSPAVTPQSPATRADSPKRYKPYIASHSRILAVTRANGRGGVSRTYSHVPLHLRDKIADSDTDITDYSTRQITREGRKIHTLARFVQIQMVRWSMP